MKKILFFTSLLFTINVNSQTNYIEEIAKLKLLKESYLHKVEELDKLTSEYNDSLNYIKRKIFELESYSKISNDNEFHVLALVEDDETKILSKPNFESKVLSILNKGESVKILDYYKGKPYTNLLFWVVNINGQKGYIQSGNLISIGGTDLILFKSKVDTRKELKKKSEIAQQEANEQQKLQRQKAADSLKRLEYLNNCQYEINGKDDFNGRMEKYTPYYYLQGNGNITTSLQIQLRRIGQNKYVVFRSTINLGCSSPYDNNRSYVKVKLKNNDIVTFYHRGDIDCGDFTLIGKITQADIYKLKNSEIKEIRLVGTKYKEDIEIADFKNIFIKKLDCIN